MLMKSPVLCKHCTHVARNTFYIEPDYGRLWYVKMVIRKSSFKRLILVRLIVSTGDHAEVKKLEEERQYQVIPIAGYGRGGCRRCSPASQKKVIPPKAR